MEIILNRLDNIDSKLVSLENRISIIENKDNSNNNENIINLKKKDDYTNFLQDAKFTKLINNKSSYINAYKIYNYIYNKENYTSPIKISKNDIVLYYNDEWKITSTDEVIKMILHNIRLLLIKINSKETNLAEFQKNQEYIIKLSEEKFKKQFKTYLIKSEKNRLL